MGVVCGWGDVTRDGQHGIGRSGPDAEIIVRIIPEEVGVVLGEGACRVSEDDGALREARAYGSRECTADIAEDRTIHFQIVGDIEVIVFINGGWGAITDEEEWEGIGEESCGDLLPFP